MFVEIMIFILFGTSIGLGLSFIPGFHINNILPLLLSIPFLIQSPYYFASLVISLSVTQLFVSTITSIFLGAPNSDNFLSILPGHRMLLQGRGYDAILSLVIGALGSLFISVFIIFLFFNYFSLVYEFSRPYIHYILILISSVIVISEKSKKAVIGSILIFLLSGILGLIVLNSYVLPRQYSLFPLLTGLFGISLLIFSMKEKSSIPEQKPAIGLDQGYKCILRNILLGSIAGIVVGFLPAIGVSQAAFLFNYFTFSQNPSDFLLTMGSINIGNEIFSIISLFLLGNPRSGASVALQRLFPSMGIYDVVLFLGIIFFTASVAASLTLILAKRIPKYLARLDYRKLCSSMIFIISSLVFIFTGFLGLLVLFTSVSIGLLCNYLGVKKSNCMGCLIVPSIIFFMGLNSSLIELLGI